MSGWQIFFRAVASFWIVANAAIASVYQMQNHKISDLRWTIGAIGSLAWCIFVLRLIWIAP